eukprot:gene3558-4062_t
MRERIKRVDVTSAGLLLLIILIQSSVFVNGVAHCHPKGTCGCEMSDGSGYIDLTPLNGNVPRFSGIPDANIAHKYTYSYNPCKSFTLGDCKDVFVCQVIPLTLLTEYFDAGSFLSTQYNPSTKQVTFVYSSSPSSTQKRTSYIELDCDKNTETPQLEKFTEKKPRNYYSTLKSKYACFIKTSTKKKKKLSTGTILCILLLVVLVLYLSFGIVFNKNRQRQGWELMPNVEFWKDLPSMDVCFLAPYVAESKTIAYCISLGFFSPSWKGNGTRHLTQGSCPVSSRRPSQPIKVRANRQFLESIVLVQEINLSFRTPHI